MQNFGAQGDDLLLVGLAGEQIQALTDGGAQFNTRSVTNIDAYNLMELAVFEAGASDKAIGALRTGGLVQLSFDSEGNLSAAPLSVASNLQQDRVSDLLSVQVGGVNFAVASWLTEETLVVFREAADGGLEQVDRVASDADFFFRSQRWRRSLRSRLQDISILWLLPQAAGR